jgi:DNA repair protein RadC
MDYQNVPNITLLSRLMGPRAAKRLYRGVLSPLFQRASAPKVGEENDWRVRGYETLAVARELVTRLLDEDLRRGDSLSSPETVRNYLKLLFAGEEREIFAALFLDAQHRLIASEKLFHGTLAQTSVYPREVVKRALEWNAAALIFAHNHPSGVAEPSHADELLTQSLKQALALVDIRTLDHFVIAGKAVVSFAERGLI